jgi:hypothetical protein
MPAAKPGQGCAKSFRLNRASIVPLKVSLRTSLRSLSYRQSMEDNVGLYELLGANILACASDTINDLPPADTKRWVARRKAMIVNAVRSGVISLEEVCRRYELSVEEFQAWQRAIETHGVAGLRVTRLQIYRDTPPARLARPRY